MSRTPYDTPQLQDLLHQALETERAGALLYATAIECAINPELKREWEAFLAQTERHRDVLLRVMEQMNLDPDLRSPGRTVVRHLGESLLDAIALARSGPDPRAAELVAAECVLMAETRDQMNWELIGRVAKDGSGDAVGILRQAYDAVEEEEELHLQHTANWVRELWIDALGLPAVLPPSQATQATSRVPAATRAAARDRLS